MAGYSIRLPSGSGFQEFTILIKPALQPALYIRNPWLPATAPATVIRLTASITQ
jgi:hypothetical protein